MTTWIEYLPKSVRRYIGKSARVRTMWAIMSREGHNNIEESTLSPLRQEAWEKFFDNIGVTLEEYIETYGRCDARRLLRQAIRKYKSFHKAVKVVLIWKVK